MSYYLVDLFFRWDLWNLVISSVSCFDITNIVVFAVMIIEVTEVGLVAILPLT